MSKLSIATSILLATTIISTLSACSGRLNPIDALPGSEREVGAYPNVHVHSSMPPKQPLNENQLKAVKGNLKNTSNQLKK